MNIVNFLVPGSSIEMLPAANALYQEHLRVAGANRPSEKCLPHGIPDAMVIPGAPAKIVQLPGLTLILYEEFARFRQIFTDGRPLPVDPNPSFNGYSSGTWDGDTLVVQTNGLKDGLWLDRSGSPLTEAAKLTERFRRINYGKLEVELTVDDAKAYTAPWTVTLGYSIVLDTDLLEYFCTENERDASHLVGK